MSQRPTIEMNAANPDNNGFVPTLKQDSPIMIELESPVVLGRSGITTSGMESAQYRVTGPNSYAFRRRELEIANIRDKGDKDYGKIRITSYRNTDSNGNYIQNYPNVEVIGKDGKQKLLNGHSDFLALANGEFCLINIPSILPDTIATTIRLLAINNNGKLILQHTEATDIDSAMRIYINGVFDKYYASIDSDLRFHPSFADNVAVANTFFGWLDKMGVDCTTITPKSFTSAISESSSRELSRIYRVIFGNEPNFQPHYYDWLQKFGNLKGYPRES